MRERDNKHDIHDKEEKKYVLAISRAISRLWLLRAIQSFEPLPKIFTLERRLHCPHLSQQAWDMIKGKKAQLNFSGSEKRGVRYQMP